MNVIQTLESVSINTNDCEIFTQLQSLMRKNFQKSIGNKGKIISFYDENESIQRKYFFKLLQNLYKKTNNKPLDLKFCEYKTLKLNFIQQNTLKTLINAGVKFDKSTVIVTFQNQNLAFMSYFLKCCDEWDIKSEQFENIISLYVSNDASLNMIEDFINTTEHLTFKVAFKYEKADFDAFKKSLKVRHSSKFIRKFRALANLLQEYFDVLECHKYDAYEDVRASYLRLIKLYHPDRHQNKPLEIQKSYSEKFQAVQNAYESLKPFFKEQENFISA